MFVSLHVPFPQCPMTPNRATQLLADWSIEQREGRRGKGRGASDGGGSSMRLWWVRQLSAAEAERSSEAKRTDRRRRDEPIGPTRPLRQQQQPCTHGSQGEGTHAFSLLTCSCSAWLPFPRPRLRLRHSLLQPLPLFPSRRPAPSLSDPPAASRRSHSPPPLPLPLVSVLPRCPLPLSMTICSSCC